MLEADTQAKPKYPWQQAVLDAFMEFRSELLTAKLKTAERTISARLYDSRPPEREERCALQDALRSLGTLLPQKTIRKKE